jgi:hypothetical protein
MIKHLIVIALLIAGTFAHADSKKKKKAPEYEPDPVVGRIVGLEIIGDEAVITVALGSDNAIGKTWKAHLLAGKTKEPLPGGEAIIIRIDRRSSVLKTKVPPDQIRANHYVQFDP